MPYLGKYMGDWKMIQQFICDIKCVKSDAWLCVHTKKLFSRFIRIYV